MREDFPDDPVVKNLPSNAGDTSSVPGWGTEIPHYTGQLSPHTATRKKVPHATIKILCSQINKFEKKKRMIKKSHVRNFWKYSMFFSTITSELLILYTS